ncbi:hypothetical protein GALL_410290 [mine drainage metagenome]|uniref:Uncharacterized protein n=1 Tax=mine drainage metagenome TaxID=410659 RepID=A0A1J5QBD8_9ZZZZ
MAGVDAVTARRLARSILEARKEGRTLRPLTNIHLLNRSDALKIQDALLDLRIGQGELLIGWYLEKSGEVAPLTDRMIFQAQPIGLVDAQRIDAVAISHDDVSSAELIIDRVVKGGLNEDFLAHGCGLVGIIMGEPIDYEIEGIREKVASALKLRNRELLVTDLVVRPVR